MMMSEIEKFIKQLESFNPMENVFNPWKCSDTKIEEHNAHITRQENLKRYLLSKTKATLILIGEAPGYKGCRFSGVAFTSEAILYKDKTKKKEATSTIIHSIVEQNKLQESIVFWNAFPFHPHQNNDKTKNRTPSKQELEVTKPILHSFLGLFPNACVIACGNTAKNTLSKINIACEGVRHPSFGGKHEFKTGLIKIIETT
ncbi:MAG: uracil-DNA glycosylase [Vampirovibrionales bacterium]